MTDPITLALVLGLAAVLGLVALLVVLARSRRWGVVCTRCAYRSLTHTEDRARSAARDHAEAVGHDCNLYHRA